MGHVAMIPQLNNKQLSLSNFLSYSAYSSTTCYLSCVDEGCISVSQWRGGFRGARKGFLVDSRLDFSVKPLSRSPNKSSWKRGFGEMTLKGGTNQACAACKYQRRKCAPTCVLAPYFPADQHKVFVNVHKLFGLKKIQKLLHVLPPSMHGEAMTSIIYQANMRDRDPVHGCVGVIYALQNQYWQCLAELFDVQYMLNVFRQQHEQQRQMPSDGVPKEDFDGASQLQMGMANMMPVSQSHSYSNSSSHCNPTLDVKETAVNSLWNQQREGNDSNNSEDEKIMPALSKLVVTSEPLGVQKESFQDYDIYQYFDTIDDKQSYLDTKEAYESSSKSSAKKQQSAASGVLLRIDL